MRGAAKKSVTPAPAPVEPEPEPRDLALPEGVEIGGHVWLADRRNGRLTEHLGRVRAAGPSGLCLVVKDNGEERVLENVQPWGADSVLGWWKV